MTRKIGCIIFFIILLMFNTRWMKAQQNNEKKDDLQVAITCSEDNAEVKIDGKSYGKTKDLLLFVFLKPGKYSLTISKPGFKKISKNVLVSSNKYHFDFELIARESKNISNKNVTQTKNEQTSKAQKSGSISNKEKLPKEQKNTKSLNNKQKQVLGQTPKYADYEDPPFPVKQTNPIYPQHLKENGISGQVWLEVEVLRNGDVGAIKIKRSSLSGKNGFDEAAIEAVKQWKYKPAKLDGKPVACWVVFPITFYLH